MPRYNYECERCFTLVELVHSMSETAEDCPECGTKKSLKKVLNIPNVKHQPKKHVGTAVKSAIEDYKQRIANERGIWEDFDFGENK